MPRIWLDATVDEHGLGSSWRPPVPPIPEVRESLEISSTYGSSAAPYFADFGPDEPRTPTISQRRRKTMPPPLKTTNARPRKKTATRRSHASPDVISSLVDSLATISSPANDHFDAIPSLSDARSRAQHPSLRRIRSSDIRLRDGPSQFASFDQGSTGAIDDAALPPVIKTAPPPSGLSPLTAPKPNKTPKESPARAMFRSGSRTSLHSQRSSEVGAPSMDSIVSSKPTSPTKAAPPPDISRTNRHKSMNHVSSHERLKQQAAEVKRAPINLGEDPAYLSPRKTRQRSHSPRKPHAFDPPGQGSVMAEAHVDDVLGAKAAGKQRARDLNVPGEGSPAVPQRQSSLLQTDGSSYASSSKASSRRKTSGNSDSASASASHRSTSNQSDAAYKPTNASTMSRMSKKQSLKFEDIQDIDLDVVKRIKELKARKELREKEAQELPNLGGPAQRTISVARHARSASDPQSPITGEDVMSKMPFAHKHLTMSHLLPKPPSTTIDGFRDDAGHATGIHGKQHPTEGRPKTPLGLLTPTEPLPINYNYVIQKLENGQTPAKPESDMGSTKSEGGRTRPKSFLLTGGRAEAGRKHAGKARTEPSTESNSQVGSRHGSLHERGHSEELPHGRHTDDFTEGGRSRSSSMKQRWSHPTPNGEPKARLVKEKVDSFAVKPPPTPVPEERPMTSHSVDSVDDDVKAFVHAPRLTQKIRHPQTGRTIAFSEVGDPTGYAVFCCVGMGLTRYITAFYDELAMTLKLRLITPDRPGVGESQSDPTGTPLSWSDDIIAICQALRIKTFSVMAHSAGAIYALATALRVPQHIRGKVHLLAPWIPPSQMEHVGMHTEVPPTTQLPRAQRFLRVLPTPFLKVANSSFMTATSASLSPKAGGTPSPSARRKRAHTAAPSTQPTLGRASTSNNPSSSRPSHQHTRRESMMLMDQTMPNGSALSLSHKPSMQNIDPQLISATTLAEEERRRDYDAHLTRHIWDLATMNANPAVDLLVCLERTQPIGFRYVDINRAVVIHHGSKDTRVPVENVKWLGKTMRKCEVRILEGEGHGLMASAGVMGGVLMEISKEWDEWSKYTAQKRVEKQYSSVNGGPIGGISATAVVS